MKAVLLVLGLIIFTGFGCLNGQNNQAQLKTANSLELSKNPININNRISNKMLRQSFDTALKDSALVKIAELRCFPERRMDCDLNGCTDSVPATYYFVDHGTEKGSYFRCDEKGCDSYNVTVIQSGFFKQYIPTDGQAMLFKINDETLEFIDVATVGTASIVSVGFCTRSI